jgi:MOSC domain-containing protein YiiM
MHATGTVVSIHIAVTGSAPMKVVREVRALMGQGLDGDRYAVKLGTYSNDPGSGRAVTLIEFETIEALRRDYQIALETGATRRNLVTRGVALNHLVGVEFAVGDALLRGTRLCDPCAHMERLTIKGALRGLIHRGGLRAEIVKGGMIRVGDLIKIPNSKQS